MSSALAQMVDMGIPRARARVALQRTKDDVMSAAERVFAGDFDEIPSEDEDEGGLPTTTGDSPGKDRDDAEDSDSMDGSEEDFFGLDNGAGEDELDDGGVEKHESDPYANVFFSKERVEEVIEPIVPIEETVSTPILRREEWMRGCPEGNEQSLLFQHYTYLDSGVLACPAGCGHSLERSPTDFFALYEDFPTYEAHILQTVRRACPKCSQIICMACGEKVKVKTLDKGKGSLKHEFQDDSEKLELLHCPNIQGVVIGMGLYLIDRIFHSSATHSDSVTQPNTPPAKRSKLAVPLPVPAKGPGSEKLWHVNKNTKAQAVVVENDDNDEEDDFMFDIDDVDDAEDGLAYPSKGKGGASAKGTGYAGNVAEDMSGQLAAAKAQKAADAAMVEVLGQVQHYLPSLARRGAPCVSDHMVHPTALAHLRRRSTFVNDLLKNESLVDMSTRSGLYRALFSWLRVISNHESLASMLAMPQMKISGTKISPDDPTCRIVTYEGSHSPRELLENCVIQAEAAMTGLRWFQNASKGENESSGAKAKEKKARMNMTEAAKYDAEAQAEKDKDEDAQLTEFCGLIVDSARSIDKSLIEVKGLPFVERMRASLPNIPDEGKHVMETKASPSSTEAVMKIYEEWAMQARFQYCDMTTSAEATPEETTAANDAKKSKSESAFKHYFHKPLVASSSYGFRGRMRAIAQELGILSTSLPVAWNSSIFVKVDSARPDCLKAMIIGPQGTPYENGCFLFDIYLPEQYNVSCPKVQSMTTNGGRYRYNPNLYADGKVCLSLLGTWAGPGWISGKSTLLQVLISIQSLILCEEPYLNEPGWSNCGGSAASKAYSANVRRMVLKDAMANNLKTPPFPFENEINTHFRLKKDSIKLQIEEWRKLDDRKTTEQDGYSAIHQSDPDPSGETGQSSGSPFARAATQLIEILDAQGDA